MATGAVLHTMQVLVGGEVYAHVARGLLFDGRALTLVDLAPSTIWSSSTPTPALGYLPTGAYLDLWAQRAQHLDRPDSCHVRGTLSLLDPDAHLAGDAVLTLGNPRVTESWADLRRRPCSRASSPSTREPACCSSSGTTVGTLTAGTGPPSPRQREEPAR